MADATVPWEGLSVQACGFVLAVILDPRAPVPDVQAAAAALFGAEAAACRDAVACLAALDQEARAQSIARLRVAVAAPVPVGIERIHPGWLRAVLEREATEVLLAISAGLPAAVTAVVEEIIGARGESDSTMPTPLHAEVDPEADQEGVAELRRAVFGSLAAVPDPAIARQEVKAEVPDWQPLAALSTDQLMAELARRGAEALGLSLAGAPPAVVARAAARAGAEGATAVLEAARHAATAMDRDRSRAQVARATSLSEDTDLGILSALGLVAMAERLASAPPPSIHAVAQRLPPAVGRTLLAEHARAVAARVAAQLCE